MRISLRLYRLLLKLYPASFREIYGGPLQRQFKDDFSEVRGPSGLLRFWVHTLIDFIRSMPAQLAREVGEDAKHATRIWRRRPLHTAFTIAVLAIAIGANTGVFSVLNALLLRSLPFEDAERLARLHMFLPPGGSRQPAVFHEWRQQSAYLEDTATHMTGDVNVDGARDAGRTRLTETSWNFFSLLGSEPVIGRGFAPGDDTPGGEAVAVIGHGLWQQMFAMDPRAIGATIRLNGVPLTIVGVAPAGFDYPQKTAIWSPTVFDYPRIPKTGVSFVFATGRVKQGVTWPQARQALETEAFRLQPALRQADDANRPALLPLREHLAGPISKASLVLMTGVGLLLLLACANIANFFLARTLSRAGELAIRTALGASRARLVQQILTETILLSLIAATLGLLVAVWTTELTMAYQPAQLAAQAYTVIDPRVLLFTAALSIATGVIFGAGPAFFVARFAASSRTATATRRQVRARSALIATQMAVTIVLLTASLALGRSFVKLLTTDNGFELASLATMSVSFAGTSYMANSTALGYYDEVVRRLREIPGVVGVSATGALPLAIDGYQGGSYTIDNGGPPTFTTTFQVAPDYFRTMGGRLIAGREFTAGDLGGQERLAVVSEELARAFGEPPSAVGRLLTTTMGQPRKIIGVVRGMRDSGPSYDLFPQAFFPARAPRSLTIVARVSGDAGDRVAIIRDTVASVDPLVPVFDVKTMDQRLDEALARPKFYATAVVFFGGLALLLSVIGVYGIVSYACGERIREMGIRLALGTTPSRLRVAVVMKTFVAVLLGSLAGMSGAMAASRYLQNLIRGADSGLALMCGVAVAGTMIVAALATWSATRRVAHLDIMEALRPEGS